MSDKCEYKCCTCKHIETDICCNCLNFEEYDYSETGTFCGEVPNINNTATYPRDIQYNGNGWYSVKGLKAHGMKKLMELLGRK